MSAPEFPCLPPFCPFNGKSQLEITEIALEIMKGNRTRDGLCIRPETCAKCISDHVDGAVKH